MVDSALWRRIILGYGQKKEAARKGNLLMGFDIGY
jgi:hypothetical protein